MHNRIFARSVTFSGFVVIVNFQGIIRISQIPLRRIIIHSVIKNIVNKFFKAVIGSHLVLDAVSRFWGTFKIRRDVPWLDSAYTPLRWGKFSRDVWVEVFLWSSIPKPALEVSRQVKLVWRTKDTGINLFTILDFTGTAWS